MRIKHWCQTSQFVTSVTGFVPAEMLRYQWRCLHSIVWETSPVWETPIFLVQCGINDEDVSIIGNLYRDHSVIYSYGSWVILHYVSNDFQHRLGCDLQKAKRNKSISMYVSGYWKGETVTWRWVHEFKSLRTPSLFRI